MLQWLLTTELTIKLPLNCFALWLNKEILMLRNIWAKLTYTAISSDVDGDERNGSSLF